MSNWSEFSGANAGYVLELYERFRRDPQSVDQATRAFFAHWAPPENGHATVPGAALAASKIVSAANLAHAIRAFGHLAARLDPLGTPPTGDPSLEPASHGITDNELQQLPGDLVGGPVAAGAANALEVIQRLREIYTSTIGYDYEHIHVPAERDWLRQAAESGDYSPPRDPIDGPGLLERLVQIQVFESYVHRVLPGKTRFSLQGLDMLVPMLDVTVERACQAGVRRIVIGMAHRGRLNVLAHVLNKPYAQILAEFKDPVQARDATIRETMGWTGDVKYHAGAVREMMSDSQQRVVITMPPNPSHVESADPVAEGMARAAAESNGRAGPMVFDESVALPILLHGDAAFSGQGIVAETLNLSRLEGYRTGGTVHIIENNQLGYTTEPAQARSTLYASDLAKGFGIPVVHVNADDPEACIEAARQAIAFRSQFHKDFVIDLIGYRRYGHNEGDEPAYTQPVLYRAIADHPSVATLWSDALVARGAVDASRLDVLRAKYTRELQQVFDSLQPQRDLVEPLPAPPPPKAAQNVVTAVPAPKIRELVVQLLELPAGLNLNAKLERNMRRKSAAIDDPAAANVDWAMAEDLAFASILADGIPIRLTGEDVERGTFGQRHAVLHDAKTGRTHVPLDALQSAKAGFAVYNSPLSENAALGYEYGYNLQEPSCLVVWEAQYGDFVNGAQMIVDEYLLSARGKWGQTPSLVLLLPHGWEGAGPDHSSGRLERFLELAADVNVRIAYPTTAAQYFHLLRRQAALLKTDPLPLVVMTPKSLLRHPLAASALQDLVEGRWQAVIDDPEARARADDVRRLILCSGKIYSDVLGSEWRDKAPSTAIVRVEQLYPFPEADVAALFDRYARCEQVIWLQEEPENMGAWTFVRPRLEALVGGGRALTVVARPRNASPAEGSLARHLADQSSLIARAFSPFLVRALTPEG